MMQKGRVGVWSFLVLHLFGFIHLILSELVPENTITQNQEYQHSLEVSTLEEWSADLLYDPNTAKLVVTVWRENSTLLSGTYRTTSCEISLWATRGFEPTPPKSCSSDLFYQHSDQNVTFNCGETEILNRNFHSGRTVQCVQPEAVNFSVEFRHVYTATYCLIVTPRVGVASQKPFNRIVRYETMVAPVDVINWNTTMDVQPMHSNGSIHVGFIAPPPDYEFSGQLRVDLLRLTGDGPCDDLDKVDDEWTRWVNMNQSNSGRAIEVEFHNLSSGFYCVVVTPIDEKCSASSVWIVQGGSCSRHSPRSVYLKAINVHSGKDLPGNVIAATVTTTSGAWIRILLAVIGVVLFCVIALALLRWKKKQAQSLALMAKTVEQPKDTPLTVTCRPEEKKIEVLLLYSRSHPDVVRLAANLRRKLQLTRHFKAVYDYGDENQWEDMAVEGVDWLHKRILPETNRRVILIQSKEASELFNMPPTKEDDQTSLLEPDRQFRYALQLLHSCRIERNQDLYRHVFTVRFSELSSPEELAEMNLLTPFRCYQLPSHFSLLVQHLLAVK